MFNSFAKFHASNPLVWELFKRFSFDVINSGHARYSSDAICHRIRWHTDIETKQDTVKITNNHTAYYARLFHASFPNHDGFFKNRMLVSSGKQSKQDGSVRLNPEAGEEDMLKIKLTNLLK